MFMKLIHPQSSLFWSKLDRKNRVLSEQKFAFVQTCLYRLALLLRRLG